MPPASLRKGPLGRLPRKTRGSLRVHQHPHPGAPTTPHRPHPQWPNPTTAWSSSVASNTRRRAQFSACFTRLPRLETPALALDHIGEGDAADSDSVADVWDLVGATSVLSRHND